MSFSQLTYRESLRDIEVCLTALSGKLYHCGIMQPVSKSTLAEAYENRDWRIYADFAQILIREARRLYKTDNEFLLDIDNMAYALDSTTIGLCLTLFPWARFRKAKGAVKTGVKEDEIITLTVKDGDNTSKLKLRKIRRTGCRYL